MARTKMLAELQKKREQEQREKEEEQRRRELEQWWSEQEEEEEEDQDQNLQTPMEQGTTAPMIQEENVQKQLEQARSNLNRVTEELKRSQTHLQETQRENIALYEKMKVLLNDPEIKRRTQEQIKKDEEEERRLKEEELEATKKEAQMLRSELIAKDNEIKKIMRELEEANALTTSGKKKYDFWISDKGQKIIAELKYYENHQVPVPYWKYRKMVCELYPEEEQMQFEFPEDALLRYCFTNLINTWQHSRRCGNETSAEIILQDLQRIISSQLWSEQYNVDHIFH
ncbi:hypothetical protein TVAG_396320 [Trichomonas vaginalis G3]|uniref:Uncharacterized protein n=1 Tax=Trichomonas vaginalis (strain ATCC PRA-98 / G3) TaxID=412133 RepID=A2ESE2_TRIV3|nr:hypothetical protein TVAGG3_0883090 [Trichomonas vaginalis G3]EAY04445.1 hypothetical protein TVAG_396320 [Trichomonas vaginalis G3]KAI5502193.1 hypothetical protein TVAGG3_0883090 [Trichomonas vaginalis G3]|eukprot:XP_001316668.1 hypothetical protein [Trichomonas vaginalis G3]